MTDLILGSDEQRLELAIVAWLDAKSQRSGSVKTAAAYRSTLQSFRSYLWGHQVDLDGPAQVIALLAQRWAGSGTPASATYNQRLAILSSFYGYALRHDLLPANPISRVDRRPVQSYGGAQALDYAELRRRLSLIDRSTQQGLRDYALLAVALQTGRRLSELAALRWGAVQLRSDRLTIHWRRTKGGKQMQDALPRPTAQALLEYLAAIYRGRLQALPPDAPVWVSFSRRNTGEALTIQTIADICERHLGTPKVHTLRHTFARAMEDAGAKVSDIQARLGHTSLATTGRYLAALKQAENTHGETLAELFGIGEA
ncbi:MAG: tyrosine-type recombinase/integrase [Chloroflexota bacterium]|nr:tyrosine-type recombinase/integrase [Chloroflexota bacterium]